MGEFELIRVGDASALAQQAAQDFVRLVDSEAAPLSVALAGGRIAGQFFSAVARLAEGRDGQLAAAEWFWSDERCVPPEDERSNYRLAREHLLEPLHVPTRQIHRIRGELVPQIAAAEAEAEVRRLVGGGPSGQPALDLVFLGVGEEGHVASLFPGEPAATVADPAVFRAVVTPKPPPQRLTMGYPALAAAKRVWVLASGAGKEGALRESLAPTGRTPLARVIQSRTQTRIYTDLQV